MSMPSRSLVAALVLMSGGLLPRESRAADSQSHELPAFSVLEIQTAVSLDLRVDPSAGPNAQLLVTEEPDDRGRTQLKMEGDRLVVDYDGHWGPHHKIRISGTVPSLEAVEVHGVVAGRIAGLRGTFRVDSSGAGKLTLAGQVQRLEIELSGAGKVRAYDLAADDVKVDVSGAGKVEICAKSHLDAEVSGVGSIEYACNPAHVHREVSGIGSIHARD